MRTRLEVLGFAVADETRARRSRRARAPRPAETRDGPRAAAAGPREDAGYGAAQTGRYAPARTTPDGAAWQG